MRRSILCDAALGILVGLLLGWLLIREVDALGYLVADGLVATLLRLMTAIGVGGALAGWLLTATAERVTDRTGGWLGVPAGVGLLLAGVVGSGAPLWAGVTHVRMLAVCVGIFLAGGAAATWWRSTHEP